MSQSSNAVFITGKLDEMFIALVQYTLLGFTHRAFDSGGESDRSLRAVAVETVLYNMPQAIKTHEMAGRMRKAINADTARFISLSRDILKWPRMGDEFAPDTREVGFSKDEWRTMATQAFRLMVRWLEEFKS